MKHIISLIIVILMLEGCNPKVLENDKERKSFLSNVEKQCEIDLDKNKDWYVATIYFNHMQGSLTKQDKDILQKVAKMQLQCSKQILLISSVSKIEDSSGYLASYNLSKLRTTEVEKYLLTQKVSSTYINSLVCGVYANRVYETNMESNKVESNKANQFVEVIFLNTKNTLHINDCFVNNTDREKQ
jgi:hypothetical protein